MNGIVASILSLYHSLQTPFCDTVSMIKAFIMIRAIKYPSSDVQTLTCTLTLL